MLAGGVAEQSIADSLSQQYELLPEIVRRWGAFRSSLAAAAAPGAEQHSLLSRPPPLASLSSDVRGELQVSSDSCKFAVACSLSAAMPLQPC
jgi:hypothetical protein